MDKPQPAHLTTVRTLTVVLSYAAIASLWILLSDRAVALLFADPTKITLASTLKGSAFVVVTSLLLFRLMRRLPGTAAGCDAPIGNVKSLLVPLGILGTAILALTAGGIWQRLEHQKQIEIARLQVIADLKARQVVDWLRERQDDARVLQTSALLAGCYERWRDTGDTASRERLQAQLVAFEKSHGLAGTLLLDERGETLWGSSGTALDGPDLRAAALQAGADRHVSRFGPYRDEAGRLRLDFFAPLSAAGDSPPVVVLSVDPEDTIYPTLQSWPVPSNSGEVVLFKRDGEQVVVLNHLRHRADTAVRLRLPVGAKSLLAAKVLRGEARLGDLVVGVDYRNVPVTGVVRDIPGTDWFLVAKVDRSELYAAAVLDALGIGLAGLLALCGASAGAFLLLQRRQLAATLHEAQAQEEKLRALQLLAAITESSEDAIFAKDLEGRYLFFNRGATRITGKRPDEVLGRDDREIFPPTEAEQLIAIGRQVVAENRTVTNEEALTTAEGGGFFLSTKGPLRDAGGKVVGIFGVSRDITARKAAENALRDSEERLRLALEAAGQGLYDLNVQTGEALVSPEYALMLGYDPAEFHETNAAWIARLHPDDHDAVAAAYRDYISGTLPEYRVEFRQRTRAGDWKWILSLGKLAERDAAGRPLRMLGTHTDITERKKAEEALRENEALTRAVLDNLPIGIAVNSADPLVAFYMNDNFPLFYRTTREKLADPDAFWSAVYEEPEFREQIRRRVLEDCASGDPRRLEWVDVPVTRRGKETRYITARNTPVPGTSLMISAVWDVTERKQAEAEKVRLEAQLLQAQKMESIGRLAGGVAHDFNNMLFVILGYAERALECVDPSQPLHADLLEIRKAALRSADLTRQLLAFARKQAAAPRVLDLNAAVAGLLSMLRRLIGEDIDLAWLPREGLWSVKIDPAQVDQVLANLCVNSRDAIAGVGRISIETDNVVFDADSCADRPGLVPGEYVLLSVSDDGCGMSMEVQSHLFEPFFTTKETGRGTGLGLATVYGIVKQNEGYISASSEPGQGTTFRVYLRRCAEAPVPLTRGPQAAPPPGRGELILLVEDEASIRNLGADMLASLGYTVLCAGTPEEAVRLAGENAGAVRLLLTDVVMPGMNGRELSRRLVEANPGLGCLYMSGYTADVIALHGVLDEDILFIQKPFSLRELGWKVHEALAAGGKRVHAPAAGGAAAQPRVLYVDDEGPLLELAGRLLRRHGCEFAGYADPEAALAAFARDSAAYDVVVTDLAMPGLSGFELARRLIALRSDVPIILASGYVTPEEKRTAHQLGIRAVLQKPGTVEELVAALEELFLTLRPAGP